MLPRRITTVSMHDDDAGAMNANAQMELQTAYDDGDVTMRAPTRIPVPI